MKSFLEITLAEICVMSSSSFASYASTYNKKSSYSFEYIKHMETHNCIAYKYYGSPRCQN